MPGFTKLLHESGALRLLAPIAASPANVPTNSRFGTIGSPIDVAPINNPPAGSDALINVGQAKVRVLTVADFGYSDVDGNAFAAVVITTTASAGRLLYQAPGATGFGAVTAGQVVSVADINAGRLAYKMPLGGSAANGSFTFQVRDDGGTGGGGLDTDQTPNTITFHVQPNVAPAGQDATIVATRGGAHPLTAADFGFSDPDGYAFAGVTIDTTVTAGRLLYTAAGSSTAAAVTPGQFVTAADIAAGRLVYKLPAGTTAPSGSFTFSVHDDGGTALGGQDTDQTPNTITFVPPPNSAPSGTDSTRSIPHNYALQIADFGFSDADGDHFAAVTIATLPMAGVLYYDSNGALGGGRAAVIAGQSISAADIAAGKLTYVVPAAASGTNYASLTFQVKADAGVIVDQTPNTLTFNVDPLGALPATLPQVLDLGALGGNGFAVLGAHNIDQVGFSVHSAGDVNGDGFADVIIGSFEQDSSSVDAGTAYVVYGHAGGFSSIDLHTPLTPSQGFTITGVSAQDRLGYMVSGAGDVNGDGFDDVMVSAIYNDDNGHSAGATYVVFGKASGLGTVNLSTLDSSQGFKILGEHATDYSGYSIAAAGDINGDGFADIIVGAHENDRPGNADAGAAYVVFGHAGGFGTIDLGTLTAAQGFKIQGAVTSDLAGIAVAGVGDVNGDGIDDFVVTADRDDAGAQDAGAAYVIFGHTGGFSPIDLATPLTPSQGFKIIGDARFDYAGRSVSAAGDVNGDGFADIIIGATGVDAGGQDSGAAYVVFGKASGFGTIDLGALAPTDGFEIKGAKASDGAGFSVGGAGDINGDGFADVIVGAFGNDHGGTDRGAAYVIFGHAGSFSSIDVSTALAPSVGFEIFGAHDGDRAGRSVAVAGDVNGDGFDDLIVGAPNVNGTGTASSAGAAYIIFGRATVASGSAAATTSAAVTTGATKAAPLDASDSGFHAVVSMLAGGNATRDIGAVVDAAMLSDHAAGTTVVDHGAAMPFGGAIGGHAINGLIDASSVDHWTWDHVF